MVSGCVHLFISGIEAFEGHSSFQAKLNLTPVKSPSNCPSPGSFLFYTCEVWLRETPGANSKSGSSIPLAAVAQVAFGAVEIDSSGTSGSRINRAAKNNTASLIRILDREIAA
jgi:hypothetical protein